MSTSFIDFKGKGYWIPDGFVEVVSWFIYLEVERVSNPAQWMLEMKKNFYEISQERFPGWNSFLFDEYLTNRDRVSFFSGIIDSCIESIQEKGNVISTKELNLINKENMPGSGRWTEDLEVSRIVNLLLDIKKMIHYKGGYEVKDSIDYSW